MEIIQIQLNASWAQTKSTKEQYN